MLLHIPARNVTIVKESSYADEPTSAPMYENHQCIHTRTHKFSNRWTHDCTHRWSSAIDKPTSASIDEPTSAPTYEPTSAPIDVPTIAATGVTRTEAMNLLPVPKRYLVWSSPFGHQVYHPFSISCHPCIPSRRTWYIQITNIMLTLRLLLEKFQTKCPKTDTGNVPEPKKYKATKQCLLCL